MKLSKLFGGTTKRTTGETTVQNTNFIINITTPQHIYGPTYALGHIEGSWSSTTNISSHFQNQNTKASTLALNPVTLRRNKSFPEVTIKRILERK
jgi:hypothetical protein